MIKCPHCDGENPDSEVLCIRCGLPLRPGSGKEGSTRLLENEQAVTNQPRWGTARLGAERKLLLHIRGHDKPLVVNVADELVLGRVDVDTGEVPQVDLTDYGALDMGVSRRHAAILIEDESLKVMDLDSANATYMNGQKLIARQARILRDGDELRLGHLIIRVDFA